MGYNVYENGSANLIARFDTRENAESFVWLQCMTDVRRGIESGGYFIVENR